MFKNTGNIAAFFIVFASFWSCSDFNKLLKSTDMDLKYKEAVKYYDKGDCTHALTLFEELASIYKGTAKAESIYYYYAYANYCVGDYYLAAYHFRLFTKIYPYSKHVEECSFMGAYCYYQESSRWSLDPTDTRNAIKELQFFINKYPTSARLEECNKLIDFLRQKLEKKAFEQAKLYYNMEDYKGAMVSVDNMLKEFPDTKFREDALFIKLKASYKLATKSIENKKLDRLKTTVDLYEKFKGSFPNSKYLKEAEKIYADATKLQSETK